MSVPTQAPDTVAGSGAERPARREAGVPLRRRRGLPGGRAVAGGFLVAAAGVGVFAAYLDATAGPSAEWAVAARDIVPGQELATADVGVIAADLPAALAGQAHADPEGLVGAVATAPLARGELIQASHVVPGGARVGREEVSFPIPSARAVAGTIEPGERVDVLVSLDGVTDVVVRDALVSGLVGGDPGIAGGGDLVVTLALEQAVEALAVVHATHSGDVTLVRPTGRDLADDAPWRFPLDARGAPGASDGDGADATTSETPDATTGDGAGPTTNDAPDAAAGGAGDGE